MFEGGETGPPRDLINQVDQDQQIIENSADVINPYQLINNRQAEERIEDQDIENEEESGAFDQQYAEETK